MADNPEGSVEVVLRQADTKIECTVTWPDDQASDHDLECRLAGHRFSERAASLKSRRSEIEAVPPRPAALIIHRMTKGKSRWRAATKYDNRSKADGPGPTAYCPAAGVDGFGGPCNDRHWDRGVISA